MEKIKYYNDKELYGIHEMIDDIQRHGLLADYEYNQALDICIITAWTGRGWKMMRTVSRYKPTMIPNRTSILRHNTERHIAVETIIKEYEQFIQKEKEKEMKNNEQKFTRDDLKLGHIIKLRNGKYYSIQMVGKGTLIATDGERDWQYLSNGWDDRLNSTYRGKTYPAITYDETKDIVEVYGYVQGCDYYAREAGYISPDHRPLLWFRQEAKKMTVEEIEKVLGYKVEIVSD